MIWGGNVFFHDLIRKYVVVFGKMFDDITILRSTANNVTQSIKVPMAYASKEKMIARLKNDPDLDRPFSVLLPRISFEIVPGGFVYNSDRKLSSTRRKTIRNANNVNVFDTMYTPVPWDIKFNLYVYAKNQFDGAKIVEKILPFFTPEFTNTIELIPSMKVSQDIPIILDSVSLQDIADEGDLTKSRMILWSLGFTMEAYFYGPIIERPMIKFITMNEYASAPLSPIGLPTTIGAYVNSTSNSISLTSTGNNSVAVGIPTSGSYFAQIDDEFVYVSAGQGTLNLTVTRGVQNTAANVHFEGAIFQVLGDPEPAASIISQPGLTANGQSTDSVNNSISYTLIDVASDYGFASELSSNVGVT